MQQGEMNAGLLHDAISAHRFGDVASICDNLELELAAKGIAKPDDWPYSIHLIGYIYVSDMNGARFLWKRIPTSVKQSQPELVAVWKIGQCMWMHDYAGVHEALRGYNWGQDIQPLVAAVAEDYSKRMCKLLSTAYSTISVDDAAAFLGLTHSEAIHFTLQQGWTLDSSSQMLTVKPPPPVSEQKLDSSKLKNLTEYVFQLEH
eukprot:c25155_g2_i1 orf=259-867(-)